MAIDWILVADRTKAEILHALPGGQGPFPTIADFVHEQGRLQPRERNSDEPSRVMTPGGSVAAHEPHEDRDHVEAKRFAAELVGYLESRRQEQRFDQLTVVAPPKFLGVLRDAWTPSLQKMIRTELPQDLMQLPQAELQARLENLVTASAT